MSSENFSTIQTAMSFAGFCLGAMALVIALRKDAHHIRLELTPVKYGGVVLGVNNDSSCEVGIIAVGHFGVSGRVAWVEMAADHVTNKFVHYPMRVAPRSLRAVLLVAPRDVPYFDTPHGYCIQLETGRLYVLRHGAPLFVSLRMHMTSLVSRLTRGAWCPGIGRRPRLPTQT